MQLAKQKVYKKVFELACLELLQKGAAEQALNAGALYSESNGEGVIEIPHFDEALFIGIPGFSFKSSKAASVSLVSRIIVIHHLIAASGEPLLGEQAAYEDIPGARHYLPVFDARVSKPLASAFGYHRDAFLESGMALGGKEEEYGDASFTIFAFPRAPLTFILWEGDDEFPPVVRTLFDKSVSSYLPLEDIVVLSKLATTRIIKTARLRYAEEVGE